MRNIRDELAGLTVIYRMLECGDRIPVYADGTDYSFLEPILENMLHDDLIQVNGEYWEPTAKGVALRDRMAQVHDQLLQFEIFGNVNLNQLLTDEQSGDGENVYDHVYDPRFQEPENAVLKAELGSQDLRIAMITFLRDEMSNVLVVDPEAFDPRRLVFLRMLADGAMRGDIWFDLRLGKPFDLVDEIVNTAYKWNDLTEGNVDNAKAMMRSIYTAGMLERMKRDGDECSKCGIPLALFEKNGALNECPNPDCRANLVEQRQQFQEQVVDEEITEETWTTYCEPSPWFDPFDPFVDAAMFSLLCCSLW